MTPSHAHKRPASPSGDAPADSSRTYVKIDRSGVRPRIPLEGSIELTYRCNYHCRHCWLWEPDTPRVQEKELSFDAIREIVEAARAMGCRTWSISGGEPMLRPDFPEIFEYITRRCTGSTGYSLNTNGSLITPEIARLMRRGGSKVIALYGATAEVYDHITRHPGGFEALMRGIAYLKEAGAAFTIQVIPLRDNLHQWDEMLAMAERLATFTKLSSTWMYLSASGSPVQNRAIKAQRIAAEDVVRVDPPSVNVRDRLKRQGYSTAPKHLQKGDDRLFAKCIDRQKSFHIDAYGGLSWCYFIKDPRLRYDLRQGTFQEAWEDFLPACKEVVRADAEWFENCGSCDLLEECRWCASYAYLETGRFTAPIPYLCDIAKATREYKEMWVKKHRRYFQVGGVTVQVDSDLDLDQIDFRRLSEFAVDGPGEELVTIRQKFALPDLDPQDMGEEIYRRASRSVFRKDDKLIYKTVARGQEDRVLSVAIFNADHSRGVIYKPPEFAKIIQQNGMNFLCLFASDHIWLSPFLAWRGGLILHASAARVNGKGLVFVGHSGAGKSTTMEMLMAAEAEGQLDELTVLCDDRNVVRKWPEGWRVHGTWSHGTVDVVSPESAPLAGIFLLQQDTVNRIERITSTRAIWKEMLVLVSRTAFTASWWNKAMDVLEQLIADIPVYRMRFDKSGEIVPDLLERISD
jgi:MoaA/NifB/PqqE/SkfB family radical SAM enzyme